MHSVRVGYHICVDQNAYQQRTDAHGNIHLPIRTCLYLRFVYGASSAFCRHVCRRDEDDCRWTDGRLCVFYHGKHRARHDAGHQCGNPYQCHAAACHACGNGGVPFGTHKASGTRDSRLCSRYGRRCRYFVERR